VAADQSPISRLITEQPSGTERRAAARARLRRDGKIGGQRLKPAETATEMSVTDVNPGETLKAWLKPNSNIELATATKEGSGFERAARFVESSTHEEVLGQSVSGFRELLRTLKAGDESYEKGGRESQMKAARTFRRNAEIEMLVAERKRNVATAAADSRWRDSSLAPPPGFYWKRCEMEPRSAATGTTAISNRGCYDGRQGRYSQRRATCITWQKAASMLVLLASALSWAHSCVPSHEQVVESMLQGAGTCPAARIGRKLLEDQSKGRQLAPQFTFPSIESSQSLANFP